MIEYRDTDQTRGYCPRCGRELSSMTDTRGYCDRHGWQWVDWTAALIMDEWIAAATQIPNLPPPTGGSESPKEGA